MRADRSQAASSMTTRQKVTIGVFVLVIIIIIWQIFGMFGGKNKAATSMPSTSPSTTAMKGNSPGAPPPMMTPQSTELMKLQQPLSQREMDLMRLQQETQEKYLGALNELQMLKISREIAETNQAIATAKLATVTAERNIVNILAPQPQQIASGEYARGLINPIASGRTVTSAPQGESSQGPIQGLSSSQQQINYSVISVSQLQYKWSAVLGYQGNLYNVFVGDVLPADGSNVISIDKSGVTLEKEGVKKKLSLVPII